MNDINKLLPEKDKEHRKKQALITDKIISDIEESEPEYKKIHDIFGKNPRPLHKIVSLTINIGRDGAGWGINSKYKIPERVLDKIANIFHEFYPA